MAAAGGGMPAPVISFETAIAARAGNDVVTALIDGGADAGEAACVAILRCTAQSAEALARTLSSALAPPSPQANSPA